MHGRSARAQWKVHKELKGTYNQPISVIPIYQFCNQCERWQQKKTRTSTQCLLQKLNLRDFCKCRMTAKKIDGSYRDSNAGPLASCAQDVTLSENHTTRP